MEPPPAAREFPAYPPNRQKRSIWASPMVRVIVGLMVVFLLAQLLLYRMAIRSVHAMDYDQHKVHDDLDIFSDLVHRFKKAYAQLIF
jgi:uncharacterized membrane-anchored protein YhcB (DUF1043 family)